MILIDGVISLQFQWHYNKNEFYFKKFPCNENSYLCYLDQQN